MPAHYSHTILPEKRTIIQRFSGRIGLEDVIQATEKLWQDPNYDRSYNGITDLRQCSPGASVSDVRSLAHFISEKQPNSSGRWVLIAQDPMITVLGILYARTGLKPSLEVCSTWDAACAHLQADLPATD